MEQLERRNLLASTLYVDFGDLFPVGGMTGTVGTLKTATSGVPGDPAVAGPDMDKDTNSDFVGANTDDPDPFTMVSFNNRFIADGGNYPGGVSQLRSDIMSFVRRSFQPFSIEVIELTASSIDVNGRPVQGASSLADISSNMGANEAGVVNNNDGYVLVTNTIVHRPAADGGDIDMSSVWGGYASVIDMPDSNDSDNTAIGFVAPGALGPGVSAGRWGNLIAHEAGHLFGFQHSLTNAPSGAVSPQIPTSEIMSYLGGNGFNFFSRHPQVRGNGNTTNNEDLMAVSPPAPVANRTPYDQWINTPSIGMNPLFHHITGTGAHDIITITKNGSKADVTIQAFSDANYTSPLFVPGSGGASTVYSYSLAFDRLFIVDGGDLNDRFVIDGDLSTDVLVRGMSGTDHLVINGKGLPIATYTVGSDLTGLDGNPDLRGVYSSGPKSITFQEFESDSTVSLQSFGRVFYQTAPGADVLTIDSPSPGQGRINSSTSSVSRVQFLFSNVSDLFVDAGYGDVAPANDVVTINSLPTTGLDFLEIFTNIGDDVITVGSLNPLPGALTIFGGPGYDRLVGPNELNTWTINGLNRGTLNPGGVTFRGIDVIDGGNNIDTFNILASTGSIELNGHDGNDVFNLSSDGAALSGNVSAILGSIAIDGGSGNNQLVIVDATGSGNTNVVISSNVISGIAPAIINYTATSGGNFSGPGLYNGVWIKGIAGTGDDFLVDSFLAQNTLQIDSGGGNDVITTGADALGNMKLDGQDGFDIVTIQAIDGARRIDARDSGIGAVDLLQVLGLGIADDFVIRATSVRRNVVDRVDFNAETERLEVLSRDGDDIFNIAASSAGQTFVGTGNGVDFVQVIDTVGGMRELEIFTGLDSDRVRVLATQGVTSTTIETEEDNDFVFIGSNLTMNNGSLDRLLGLVRVFGGSNAVGEDRLYINDRATLTGQRYEIDSDSVSSLSPRLFTLPINHFDFEVLRLDGTDKTDEFVVYPNFTTRFVIDGNLPNREDIACADEGDFLNLVAPASSGRKLNFTDVSTGSGSWTFSNGFQGVHFTSIEKFNHVSRLAVGSDAFLQSLIKVYDAETRNLLFRINPYESWFTGGVRVATGDMNGDGIPDIIAAPGAGRAPEVRIYNGLDGSFLQSFLAYDQYLWDGVLISAGDVAGSCGVDIVTTPGPGRGLGQVRVWENQPAGFALVDQFLPFGPNFYGGASNAIADFNGDGAGDIAVGALHGLAHVAVFDGAVPAGASELARFLPFGNDFLGGVHLAVGNVIGSDKPDLIVSAGENAWSSQYSSRVHVYDGANLAYTPNVYDAPDFAFTAFAAESEYARAATRVVAKDYDLDGAIDELFVSQGPAGQSHQVKVFLPASGSLVDSIYESDSLFDHGMFVG